MKPVYSLPIFVPMFVCLFVLFVPVRTVHATVYKGNPSNYASFISKLKPGDTLQLSAGTYPKALNVKNIRGTKSAWITITGPTTGTAAKFVAQSCCNTVEIFNASYIAIRHLHLDGQKTKAAFAISAKDGSRNNSHHIRIENNLITDYNGNQQIVGISTKSPTWNWEIRGNRILRAGTGMYLGNSNGKEPFIGGIIEYNLIQYPTGYCMQIKHQYKRIVEKGMPTQPMKTIIRHNVFIKDKRVSTSGDRPNVLLGGLPPSGAGAKDEYEVYGNFFFDNPREALLQAEGRVTIHDNIFVGSSTSAIVLRKHNIALLRAYVYNNTVFSAKRGLYLGTVPSEGHQITGNLFMAREPMGGRIANKKDNIDVRPNQASAYVVNASLSLANMNFMPTNKASGGALDLSAFKNDTDALLDFNGRSKGRQLFRGAYAMSGPNPGWKLAAAIKKMTTTNPPKEPSSEPSNPEPSNPEPLDERPAPVDAGQQEATSQKEPLSPDTQTPEPGTHEPFVTKDQGGQADQTPNTELASKADSPQASDASSSDGAKPTEGCGCQSTSGSSSFFTFGLLLFAFVFVRRKRSERL